MGYVHSTQCVGVTRIFFRTDHILAEYRACDEYSLLCASTALSSPVFLGIDAGTQGLKALVYERVASACSRAPHVRMG